MKKLLTSFLSYIFLFFVLPALCTVVPKKVQETVSNEENNTNDEVNVAENNTSNEESTSDQYDYQKYKTIKLLHSATGDVEESIMPVAKLGLVKKIDWQNGRLMKLKVIGTKYWRQ